ncbi:legumain [Anabrus simplex]|uniref:legumain n=1 Tax=Anabrus simplex TaxID=316456 RepID=UPI0035A319E2
MMFAYWIVSALVFASTGHCYHLPGGGKIWALLVAGSSGYDNYRHQADVCHAYQILHENDIPDENIIVMMYDDIAYNEENPRQGVIINRPHGHDVYRGVPKDYTGDDVNSTNFLKILTGDEDGMSGIGSGRVLKSGPNDHVFVNFVDHGAPGLVAFPNDELYANDLEAALQKMVNNSQFAKLVLFVEACESGSMFENILPDYENIFVMTAADPHESSYACYYDETLSTYLGDVFSVKWMEDVEEQDISNESLHHLFEEVRYETNTSHVEEYGDLDLGALHVSKFLGDRSEDSLKTNRTPVSIEDAVPSHHVPLAILQRKLEAATDPDVKEELKFKIHKMLKLRRQIENTMKFILHSLFDEDQIRVQSIMDAKHSLTPENFGCYRKLATHFSDRCYKFSENPYALRQLYILKNLCVEGAVTEVEVMTEMDQICANMHAHVRIV